jgi:hypothetical protein
MTLWGSTSQEDFLAKKQKLLASDMAKADESVKLFVEQYVSRFQATTSYQESKNQATNEFERLSQEWFAKEARTNSISGGWGIWNIDGITTAAGQSFSAAKEQGKYILEHASLWNKLDKNAISQYLQSNPSVFARKDVQEMFRNERSMWEMYKTYAPQEYANLGENSKSGQFGARA